MILNEVQAMFFFNGFDFNEKNFFFGGGYSLPMFAFLSTGWTPLLQLRATTTIHISFASHTWDVSAFFQPVHFPDECSTLNLNFHTS